MKSLTLGAIADFSGGAITQGKLTDRVSSITKDTRSMQGGELYVALVGENFDGHDYVQQAAELGAAAVLVQRAPPTKLPASCAVIHVDDTLRALQSLARRYRLHLSITAVGITGSNGKTIFDLNPGTVFYDYRHRLRILSQRSSHRSSK